MKLPSDMQPKPVKPPRSCDWCGDRPADRYQLEIDGRRKLVYVCRMHRDRFDDQRARARDAAARRKAAIRNRRQGRA